MESKFEILSKFDVLNIGDCNGNFQNMVVDKILESGKSVDELTVAELRKLITDSAHIFNG